MAANRGANRRIGRGAGARLVRWPACTRMADGSARTCRSLRRWSGRSTEPTRSGSTRSRSSSTTRPRGGDDCCHRADAGVPGPPRRADIAPVAIHASYLVNLAGSEEDFFGSPSAVLASELRAAPGSGARSSTSISGRTGAAVPSRRARAPGRRARARPWRGRRRPEAAMIVARELGRQRVRLLGTTCPSWPAIAEAIAARGLRPERLGFCLDTAHCGRPGSTSPIRPRWIGFVELDARIGLDRLVMIHLNDSKSNWLAGRSP